MTAIEAVDKYANSGVLSGPRVKISQSSPPTGRPLNNKDRGLLCRLIALAVVKNWRERNREGESFTHVGLCFRRTEAAA